MLSFQVDEMLQDVLSKMVREATFIEAVGNVEKAFSEMAAGLYGIAGNTNNSAYANQILSQLTGFRNHISGISPRKFYSSLQSVHGTLRSIEYRLGRKPDYIESLIADIDEFADKYDEYIAAPNAANAVDVILAAPKMKGRIQDFVDSFSFFRNMLEDAQPIAATEEKDEGEFSLLLSGSLDLEEFIRRLAALQSMYSEICELLDISQADFPLQISKIESGSLWAKLAGSTVAVGLMVQFLQASAAFVHQNFTTEGQIAAIPTKVESLDKVLDLREKLRKAGFKTKDIDDHLNKSAHAIAQDLNTLLERQSSITLNGREIAVAEDPGRHRMGNKAQPKLITNQR